MNGYSIPCEMSLTLSFDKTCFSLLIVVVCVCVVVCVVVCVCVFVHAGVEEEGAVLVGQFFFLNSHRKFGLVDGGFKRPSSVLFGLHC